MDPPYRRRRVALERLRYERGEPLADPVEAHLDRALGHPEEVGDRRGGEVGLVPEVHQLALLLGQGVEGLAHAHAPDELVLERLAPGWLLLGVTGARAVTLL